MPCRDRRHAWCSFLPPSADSHAQMQVRCGAAHKAMHAGTRQGTACCASAEAGQSRCAMAWLHMPRGPCAVLITAAAGGLGQPAVSPCCVYRQSSSAGRHVGQPPEVQRRNHACPGPAGGGRPPHRPHGGMCCQQGGCDRLNQSLRPPLCTLSLWSCTPSPLTLNPKPSTQHQQSIRLPGPALEGGSSCLLQRRTALLPFTSGWPLLGRGPEQAWLSKS